MDSILMLIAAVEANIISYFVCKWLDRHDRP